MRAGASTPVILGSRTEQTDALSNGQAVTVQGTRSNGILTATRITINQ